MTLADARGTAPGPTEKPLRTVVIGAGIVGIFCALELQEAGHDVILVDCGPPGGDQAASYGNGAWLSPASIMPMSVPGLWKEVPGYLADPSGPFVIRWRHLPSLLPWLVRFLRAGSSWRKVEVCAAHRYRLCRSTVDWHLKWARSAGTEHLIAREGVWFLYRDRSDIEREAREWKMRKELGVRFSEHDRAALIEREPALSTEYGFGIRVDEGAFIRDTRSYCEGLVAHFCAEGGRLVRSTARSFKMADSRLTHVVSDDESIACDRAVIAAGAWSAELARQAGDNVPLISERGYHVVLPSVIGHPPMSVMPADGKMAVTPTNRGLRIAGQVELASLHAPPNWRRADILLAFGKKLLPGLPGVQSPDRVERWMGHRPSTPDGLPSIGAASDCADIVHAFGHGHSGMIQAPATAQIVSRLLAAGVVSPEDEAFSPRRFGA
ncbi:D-amino-acid dehydrogenase [Afifella marina DSM 2698]|uniref:D-amino-acid dehydrogenase n=1 Tax=Afifella marina DSM 2698 TaxID=1120955 RepID=A0A1G5MDF4_AFIMA|nr:D-amino-acid dehydrogenase [Afifella marina DSM 2698]